jgi:hypothetical protein
MIIRRIAAQANAHRPAEEHIDVSPHMLRHTFLRKLAETKGVRMPRKRPDTRATAISGAMCSRIGRP